jgi:hypothetical protein
MLSVRTAQRIKESMSLAMPPIRGHKTNWPKHRKRFVHVLFNIHTLQEYYSHCSSVIQCIQESLGEGPGGCYNPFSGVSMSRWGECHTVRERVAPPQFQFDLTELLS